MSHVIFSDISYDLFKRTTDTHNDFFYYDSLRKANRFDENTCTTT